MGAAGSEEGWNFQLISLRVGSVKHFVPDATAITTGRTSRFAHQMGAI